MKRYKLLKQAINKRRFGFIDNQTMEIIENEIRADERAKTIDEVMIAFKYYQNMHNPKDAGVFWEQLLQMKGGAEKTKEVQNDTSL